MWTSHGLCLFFELKWILNAIKRGKIFFWNFFPDFLFLFFFPSTQPPSEIKSIKTVWLRKEFDIGKWIWEKSDFESSQKKKNYKKLSSIGISYHKFHKSFPLLSPTFFFLFFIIPAPVVGKNWFHFVIGNIFAFNRWNESVCNVKWLLPIESSPDVCNNNKKFDEEKRMVKLLLGKRNACLRS